MHLVVGGGGAWPTEVYYNWGPEISDRITSKGCLVSIADIKEGKALHSGDVVRLDFYRHQHATIPPPIAISFTSVTCSLSRFPSAQIRHDVMYIPSIRALCWL
jgi:hypothetical protein